MQSITQKMLFALVGSTIFVLILVSGVSYYNQESHEQKYWQEKRDVINSQLSVIFQEPVFAYDKPLIKGILDAILKDTAIVSLKVVDHRDKVLAHGSSRNSKADEQYTTPLMWTDGSKIGSVEIGYSHHVVNSRLNNALIEKSIALFITIILLSVVTIYFLRKIVIQPLSSLSSLLGDIAQGGGDLTQRIPIKSNDELGLLATNFNNFINTVQSIVSALALANEELSKVTDRVKKVSKSTNKDSQNQRLQTKDALEHLTQLKEATVHIAQNAEQTSINTNNVHQLS
jgi:methyl-accepting chemotaxis protein